MSAHCVVCGAPSVASLALPCRCAATRQPAAPRARRPVEGRPLPQHGHPQASHAGATAGPSRHPLSCKANKVVGRRCRCRRQQPRVVPQQGQPAAVVVVAALLALLAVAAVVLVAVYSVAQGRPKASPQRYQRHQGRHGHTPSTVKAQEHALAPPRWASQAQASLRPGAATMTRPCRRYHRPT